MMIESEEEVVEALIVLVGKLIHGTPDPETKGAKRSLDTIHLTPGANDDRVGGVGGGGTEWWWASSDPETKGGKYTLTNINPKPGPNDD